jgi:hypothetical protein
MMRVHAMKNLWIKFDLAAGTRVIHNAALSSGAFTPISNQGQSADPLRDLFVIPLPAVSY